MLKNYGDNRHIALKTSDDLDYRDITNTMLSKEDGNYDIYLSMEAFIDRVSDKHYSLIEKSDLNSTFGQFEVPYLIKYLSDKHELVFNDDETFISSVKECLNKIDGRQDIYMGISKNIAFSLTGSTISISWHLPVTSSRIFSRMSSTNIMLSSCIVSIGSQSLRSSATTLDTV